MAINFRKLKKQVKQLKPEAGGTGYIFIATDEQQNKGIFSIAQYGSRTHFMNRLLVPFIKESAYKEWREEFVI